MPKFIRMTVLTQQMPLSERTKNVLLGAKIANFGELIRTPEHQLRVMRGSGKKTIDEIKTYIAQFGYKLGVIQLPIADLYKQYKAIEKELEKRVKREQGISFATYKRKH